MSHLKATDKKEKKDSRFINEPDFPRQFPYPLDYLIISTFDYNSPTPDSPNQQ